MDTLKSLEGDDREVGPPLPPPDSTDDEAVVDVGPMPPKPKRRKVLEFEAQYLQALPLPNMYEKSYMHKDTVTQVAIAHGTDFFITASVDGHIKFWKKQLEGIEFAKHYKAHLGPVTGLVVSSDGTLCASISTDKSVKVFDVASFDMIAMFRLPFVPGCVEWIFTQGDANAALAVSESSSSLIHIFDMRSGSNESIGHVKLHAAPVTAMKYNSKMDAVVSCDVHGFLEYWSPGPGHGPPPTIAFDSKFGTDLFCLAKAKTHALSIDFSKDGEQYVVFCGDHHIRVFKFSTGKLIKSYDESLSAAQQLQKVGPESLRLDPIDFGRRVAVDKECMGDPEAPHPNAIFDESGHFILYATLLGIKVVNLTTNKVVKIIGLVENSERFLRIALYQGTPVRARKLAMAPGSDARQLLSDPTVLASAYKRQRLYLFTKREPDETEDVTQGRDIFNEKPSSVVNADIHAAAAAAANSSLNLPRGAVIQTTMGDIWLKLFADECPRTVENFTVHANNGYYDNVVFHRIIKGFMVQTGDPLGDGTGGESIWGGEFEDEIHRNLRHDRPFTVSMANAGPNTNGSQFFITTVPTPWYVLYSD